MIIRVVYLSDRTNGLTEEVYQTRNVSAELLSLAVVAEAVNKRILQALTPAMKEGDYVP